MRFPVLILALLLSGCAAPKWFRGKSRPAAPVTAETGGPVSQGGLADNEDTVTSGVLPSPEATARAAKSVASITDQIREELQAADVPAHASRIMTRVVDLNADSKPDVLALVWAPGWSDANGATLLVYQAGLFGYSRVSKISSVRVPVFAGKTRSHGWIDLLAPSGLAGQNAGLTPLQFDGKTYPDQASDLDQLPEIPQNLDRLLP
jgi:hypothetical protein